MKTSIKKLLAMWICLSPAVLATAEVSAATDLMLLVRDSKLDIDEDPDIHIMRPDGTDHRMIRTQYPVQVASINAKGDWIAYTTKGRKEIRAIHVSGTREKVLTRLNHTNGRLSPLLIKWSPDGRYIAYTRHFTRGRIGYQLYDTRTRRHYPGTRFIIGRERVGSAFFRPIRLMWAPNSKSFAAFVNHVNKRVNYTFVHDVTNNGRNIRRVRTLRGSLDGRGDQVYDFASNSELISLPKRRIGEYSRSNTKMYNFRNDTWRSAFPVAGGTLLYGVIASPDRNFFMLDGYDLTAGARIRPVWSSISGQYRESKIDRNLGIVDNRSLTFQWITPLAGYSGMSARFNDTNRFPPNAEWRRVRSNTIFQSQLCYGWVATKFGTPGNDQIVGTNGADVVVAGDGDDTVTTKGGMDIICGGQGNDTLNGGPGADILYGDHESDTDVIPVVGGDDLLIGAGGADTIFGLPGNDKIRGGGGNDYLDGGSGDDEIDGMAGADIIAGGEGTDQCRNYITSSGCE